MKRLVGWFRQLGRAQSFFYGVIWSALATAAIIDAPMLGIALPIAWFLGITGFMLGSGSTDLLVRRLRRDSNAYQKRLLQIQTGGGLMAAALVLGYLAYFIWGGPIVTPLSGLLYIVLVFVLGIFIQGARQAHALYEASKARIEERTEKAKETRAKKIGAG